MPHGGAPGRVPANVLDAVVDDLRGVVGPDHARAEPVELALYERDAGLTRGRAGAVCFPGSAEELAAVVRVARDHGVPFVARGSGTGLAGGATPVGDPIVIVTTRLQRILDVDADVRAAWVEPGVLNLDLTRAVTPMGLHYAPDPSSQAACTIGGNVGTNAGGPHCLAYGVTSAHVLALDVVLADGSISRLGGEAPDPPGYDLRGVFVGSEGTMGVAARIAVRLTPNPPELRTLLVGFPSVESAAITVSDVIASGVVPAALEMMDAEITRLVERFVGGGYPTDAAAVLLVELDGQSTEVDAGAEVVRAVARRHGATSIRSAADAHERELIWRGRRSAFGAVAQLNSDYYLHDVVVPRTKLAEVLFDVARIADEQGLTIVNVFHAGDGNLHPLISFDRKAPGVMERVRAAGDAIIRRCVEAGGVLSGEHGIGIEKREAMGLFFGPDDLEVQARVRDAFDPEGLCNPHKVLPSGSRCGDLRQVPEGVWI